MKTEAEMAPLHWVEHTFEGVTVRVGFRRLGPPPKLSDVIRAKRPRQQGDR